ncbi:MAG: hypothetical protein QM669_12370 [Siphonobacter sp.]
MLDLDSALTAYGLVPADLSDETKNKLTRILVEAGKSAAGTAILEATQILQEEAAKKGIKTGTIGTTEQETASKQVEDLAKQTAEKEAKQQRIIIIGSISVLFIGSLVLVMNRLFKKR